LANCSFGTSTQAAKGVLKPLLSKILKRDPTEEELVDYAKFFVSEILKSAQNLVKPAKNTLFVIAAGNDGMNNDEFPTSPANLKLDNTFTVAATLGYQKLAKFSNYGEKMVDVAAPGVGILSAIPGQQYLTVSGTSQATPFVVQVMGRALDQNPSLSHSDLKKIIMDTSDQKDYLKGKVASGGVINTERALAAAQLAKTMQLGDAIDRAKAQISDVIETAGKVAGFQEDSMVLPLPSLFY
jgi:subtilisin family serine protease